MSVETINNAIQQIKSIHETTQHRFVYVNANNNSVTSFYGTNWRILAAWHRFKYGIQCCCRSNIIMIGGSAEGRERAKEMLKSETESQADTIVTHIKAAPDSTTVDAYRTAIQMRYDVAAGQITFWGCLTCLSQDRSKNIRDALDDQERHFRRMAHRSYLPPEMQTALDDIQNGSKSVEERLNLIRTFLPTIFAGQEKIICMVEIKIALKSIFEQISKDPYLNSMELEAAKKQLIEMYSWYLQCDYHNDLEFEHSFYSLIGQYAAQSDPLKQQLEKEVVQLLKQEKQDREELSKLKKEIAPLKEQVEKCSQAYWGLRRKRNKLDGEYYEAAAKLSESINAYKNAKASTESLPKAIESTKQLINTSNEQFGQLARDQLYKRIATDTAALAQALKDINDPEKTALQAKNEKLLAEKTQQFEVEKKSLAEAEQIEDRNLKEIEREKRSLEDVYYRLEAMNTRGFRRNVKLQALLESITAKEINVNIGKKFLDLYVAHH